MLLPSIFDYKTIIILHEDKYNKNLYSLFVINDLYKLESKAVVPVRIFKAVNENLSDSEIDTMIDLRKLLSLMTL